MAYKLKTITLLEYIPLRIFMFILYFLPYRFCVFIGRRVGSLVYYIAKNQRKIALINLKHAFPEKSFKWRNTIARKSMENMFQVYFEFIKSAYMKDEEILKRIDISKEDKKTFDRLLTENKGIIAISGHIGNWEMVSFYFSLTGYHPYVIMRSLDNKKLNREMAKIREKRGATCVDRRANMRIIFEALKGNFPVAFLCDQNYLEGIYVNFFGTLASTAYGPVALAMKTKSPMIVIYDKVLKNGYHKIIISNILEIENKESKEKTIIYNTQKFTKCIEDIIRENPEEWLWSHGRWNTRPNGEAETFYKRDDYFN